MGQWRGEGPVAEMLWDLVHVPELHCVKFPTTGEVLYLDLPEIYLQVMLFISSVGCSWRS